jgi:hypothetical protein
MDIGRCVETAAGAYDPSLNCERLENRGGRRFKPEDVGGRAEEKKDLRGGG